MVKLLILQTRGRGFDLELLQPLYETLNRGPMTIFKDKLLTRTYFDEAGDYIVPNVKSPRGIVFRSDLSDITWTIIILNLKCIDRLYLCGY